MTWKPDEQLWKIIQRYDTYFGATNAKASFLIAFNTFILGLVVVQAASVDLVGAAHSTGRTVFIVLCLAAVVATLASLACVLFVVIPYMKSNRLPGTYHSIIFYADVADHESAERYQEQVATYNEEKFREDLTRQVHVLARGLRDKFALLRQAILITVFLQLPLFVIVVATVLAARD